MSSDFSLLQGAFELGAIGTGHGGQQPMVEDAANTGSDLRHLLAGGKPIEAGRLRILQRRRDRKGGQRARQRIVIALIDKEAGL